MRKAPPLVGAVNLYHLSRISVGLVAAVMTAASSIGLLGVVRMGAVLLAGVCTLAAYWFDDLVDLVRDEARWPGLRDRRRVRLILLCLGLGSSVLSASWLLMQASRTLLYLVAALAVITGVYCLRHALARDRREPAKSYWAQTLGWGLACILLPQADAGGRPIPQTWMALGFFWLQMYPVIDLWRRATPQRPVVARRLAAVCVAAALLIVLAVATGWFTWFNLALLASPAINLLLLWIRQRGMIAYPAVMSELVVGLNTLCGLLEIGANQSKMQGGVGPRSAADFVQLAAALLLAGIIAGNLFFRRSRGMGVVHEEDSFSAVVLLGLAVFAFQAFQSACHLQSWLMPWFSNALFDPGPWRWLSLPLTGLSLLLFAGSYREMGDSWRIGIDHDSPGALIVKGLFGRSRNPIYLAGDLFIVGAFVLKPTLAGLLYALITPVILHAQIRKEEDFLESKYGQEYRDYAARTPRYV